MAERLYPAVLEKADKAFAAWFPDFPNCVAAGATQEQAVAKAQRALAIEIEAFAERDKPLPEPTPLDKVAKPKGFLAFVMTKAEPPDPSERVNVYLPKSLIARADKRAAEMGMSRSSYFGLAISIALGTLVGPGMLKVLGRHALAIGSPSKPKTR